MRNEDSAFIAPLPPQTIARGIPDRCHSCPPRAPLLLARIQLPQLRIANGDRREAGCWPRSIRVRRRTGCHVPTDVGDVLCGADGRLRVAATALWLVAGGDRGDSSENQGAS